MPPRRPMSSPRALAAALRFEGELRGRRGAITAALARAGRTSGPVVVGPWLSEIGFELLYWIPFLRAELRRHGIGPGQVTAISRGGPVEWYDGIAGRYVDALELLDADAYRAARRAQLHAAQHEKQLVVSDLDRELWRRAGGGRAARLHPLAMYSRLRYFYAGSRGTRALDDLLEPARLAAGPPPAELGLPARYVAVKLYFSDALPGDAAGRALIAELLARLAERADVALLTTGLELDEHDEAEVLAHPRVHAVGTRLRPHDNLSVQTRVIAGASALLATYGGPSYLAPLLGVPGVAVATSTDLNPKHLLAARHVAQRLRTPALHVLAGAQPGAAAAVDRVLTAARAAP